MNWQIAIIVGIAIVFFAACIFFIMDYKHKKFSDKQNMIISLNKY